MRPNNVRKSQLNYSVKPTLQALAKRPVKDLSEMDCKRLYFSNQVRLSPAKDEAIRFKIAMDSTEWTPEQKVRIRAAIENGI